MYTIIIIVYNLNKTLITYGTATHVVIYIYNTGMFPVGDTSSGTLIAVCVCVCVCVCQSVYLSADISLYCAKNDSTDYPELCGYVGCDDATNVSNFGYEPIKFSSLKLIK